MENNKILFVSWHGLGDNVMLTPALRKYKQLNPDSYIAVAGLKRFGDILKQLLSGLSFIDEVVPCLSDAWNDFSNYKEGVCAVIGEAQIYARANGFDKVVILPTVRKFKNHCEREEVIRQEGYKLHKIFRFADEVGVKFDCRKDLQTELAVEEFQFEEFPCQEGQVKRLVLHVKAGNQAKNLTSETAESLIKDYPEYTIYEVGQKSTARSIVMHENDMELTKMLIKKADLVIAIDSVVMHIAGAFKRPLIAVFTTTPVHQAIPLAYTIGLEVQGVDNQQTQLSKWPGYRKEICGLYV